MNSYIFTFGDINGIGPEIVVKAISKIYKRKNTHIYFVCPKNIFLSTLHSCKIDLDYTLINDDGINHLSSTSLTIVDVGYARQAFGKATKTSGKISFQAILTAVKYLQDGRADAMITAPISKYSFKLAGINFPGHTELLAKLSKSKSFGMMFLSNNFHTALLTIHEPIVKAIKKLSKDLVKDKLDLFNSTLKTDLKIESPKIALLGVNPHAGENGKIGNEEINLFNPVLKKKRFFNIDGPFVPDAFFGNKLYKKYDLVIGAYHDQALIPFKLLNFNKGVNFTAGLNIIRTSPDHGTAFDIAGKNIADYESMYEAFCWAQKIVKNRKAQ